MLFWGWYGGTCMFDSLSYVQILGVPFIIYLGVFAIGLFVLTTIFMVIPKNKSPGLFKWHRLVAIGALIVGIIHAFLGVSLYI